MYKLSQTLGYIVDNLLIDELVQNYLRDITFVPFNIDYCLVQFDALNFFLGVSVHGGVST